MIHYPKPFDCTMVQGWIDRALGRYASHGYGLYAVTFRETGEFIGDCGFLTQNVQGRTETELSYHIGRTHWNQGYATEAARACRDYAFSDLAIRRLIALILPINLQSRRVAEKVGMTMEAETSFKGLRHFVYSLSPVIRVA